MILADIVRPSNRSAGSPSYPFDFITCRVRGDFEELGEDEVLGEALSEFHVVEVKSGSSQLTTNEDTLKQQCRSAGIDYVVYRFSSIDDLVRYWDLTQDI